MYKMDIGHRESQIIICSQDGNNEWCVVMQCVVMCCSTLQRVAACCSVLQHVVVCCSV